PQRSVNRADPLHPAVRAPNGLVRGLSSRRTTARMPSRRSVGVPPTKTRSVGVLADEKLGASAFLPMDVVRETRTLR
ncbi:MAG: hypothetical protein NZ843_06675, partial [Fimbriimonadales bacterium]|nr:hypothetical protein [Fimbriimonadales bacterium]